VLLAGLAEVDVVALRPVPPRDVVEGDLGVGEPGASPNFGSFPAGPPPQPFETDSSETSASGSGGQVTTGLARVRSEQRVSLPLFGLVVQKCRRREEPLSTTVQLAAPRSEGPPSLHSGAAVPNHWCVPV
jgi:hypothetical protein